MVKQLLIRRFIPDSGFSGSCNEFESGLKFKLEIIDGKEYLVLAAAALYLQRGCILLPVSYGVGSVSLM